MENREYLVKEINNLRDIYHDGYLSAQDVADFILADRARICGPLVSVKGVFSKLGWVKLNQENLREAIDATLKLSGLEK